MRFIPVLLVVLLFGASPAASQVADDKAVIPGVRIGKWTLDTAIPDLLRTNGQPTSRPSIMSTFMPSATWYAWDSLGFAAGTNDRKRTEYLALYAGRDYNLPRGAGIGASKKTVLAAFGEPALEGDFFALGGIVTVLAYDKSGLAFFLHNDSVQALLIFRPGELQDLMFGC